ncbi:MAG: AIPR family protein [Akkermansiaceae bacterium]|nr:AIPR family protein [Akkermansiaceae bacterium]
MPSLEKEQVLAYLAETYTPLIRRARCGPEHDEDERENLWNSAFPSRALACFFLQVTASLSPEDATNSDVDGGADEGIDGIHYDARRHELFLIQAKAAGDGSGHQPTLPELIRFLNGVESLMAGRLDRFTDLTESQTATVRSALRDTALKVTVVLAHFGGSLDEQRTSRIEERVNQFNRNYAEPRMRFVNFSLENAHEELLKLQADPEIDCSINLHSYAKHPGTFPCFYGRILASDLKALHDDPAKRPSLYSRNVRLYRGSNPVNERVKQTLLHEPENLFYLNNGVTALCRTFEPTPETAGRGNGEQGEFKATGFVIINGAQTIGTIAENLDAGDAAASVLLRVIVVGNDDAGIAERVAEASNYQTAVDNIDFLSMHPCNKRIASTLRASGIAYHTKRSGVPDGLREPLSFTLAEALEARVCAMGDPTLLAKLKGKPTDFYAGIRRNLGTVFPDSLSARTLWREVQICRIADEAIRNTRDGQERSIDRAFFTNGAYFLKYLILWKNRPTLGIDALHLTPVERTTVTTSSDELLATALAQGNARLAPNPDWSHTFKTIRTVQEIKTQLLRALTSH